MSRTRDERFPPTPGISEALAVLTRSHDHERNLERRRRRDHAVRSAEREVGRLAARMIAAGTLAMPHDPAQAAELRQALDALRDADEGSS